MVPGLATVILWLATDAAAPACRPVGPAVERAIAARTRELRGVEYCELRRFLDADVDGDGASDLLVLFSVEQRDGGNKSSQFVAVFPADKRRVPAMTQVGARGTRLAQGLRVVEGRILVDIEEYSSNDPLCCPTLPGRLVFKVGGGALVDETARWNVPATPPGQPDIGSVPGISQKRIQDEISWHVGTVQACYLAGLRRRPDLEGDLDVSFSIATDGHVARAAVARSTLDDEAVTSCILAEIRRVVFPRAERPTTMARYPFIFRGARTRGTDDRSRRK